MTITESNAPTSSIEITDPLRRLAFIPQLFFTPKGDQLVSTWLQCHSQYEGGDWRYFEVPRGISGRIAAWTDICITRPTGYLVPPEGIYRLSVPGNFFEGEVSADAAGIIATLMALNALNWQAYEMDELKICQGLIDRQDSLKDYVSIINHPERNKILRAID